MLLLFWILLLLTGICLFALMPAVLCITAYGRYRGTREVPCPVVRGRAFVQIDALHAALTGMMSPADLRIGSCTLWPRHSGCPEHCLADAVQAPILKSESRSTLPGPRIPLPAFLVATTAFWFVGLFWYSHYLFRAWWMQLMGFTETQVRQVVELWSPHLITVGIALLFTFALAWIIALFNLQGIWRGMGAGFLLWLGLWTVMTGVILFQNLPLPLLWLHGGYMLTASLLSGAILGVWKPGRIREWLDREGKC